MKVFLVEAACGTPLKGEQYLFLVEGEYNSKSEVEKHVKEKLRLFSKLYRKGKKFKFDIKEIGLGVHLLNSDEWNYEKL